MTNLDQIIRSRKSTYPKDFNGEEITSTELKELLSTTAYTPNHKKTTPWRFVVLQNESKDQLAKELAKLYKKNTAEDKFLEKKYTTIQDKVQWSPVIIALSAEFSGKVPEWEEEAALAMAIQNLWLKATELNIGGYWSSPRYSDQLRTFLNLNENQKCYGLFYLGKSDETIEVRDYEWEKFIEFRN